MARSAAAAIQEVTTPLPQFRRPNRADAFDVARRMFVRGERLDMQTLSAALGIGRTTLYRWVGDRERLISEVLAELTDTAWELVSEQAQGEGDERVLDTARRFIQMAASLPPLRQFAEREPKLALRILLASDSLVSERNRAAVQRAIERDLHDAHEITPDLIDIAVQVCTALAWAPIAIGGEPEIERGIRLVRSLFEADRLAREAAGSSADNGRGDRVAAPPSGRRGLES